MFNTAEHIPQLCERLAKATNRAPSTISRLASGSGTTVDRIRQGKPITIQRAERMLQYLSDHWPEGTTWPKKVARPKPSKKGGRS